MKVPAEIRKVERPKKTVVVPYRSGTYAVRARYEEFDKDGKQTVKFDQVVGYIADGKYRAVNSTERMVKIGSVDCKQYGGVYLCNRVCSSILDELCEFFEFRDAQWIYCAALLRACYPGVKDCKLANRYTHSFLSEIHTGVPFGKTTNTKMFTLLGENHLTAESYMASRIGGLKEDDLVIVDGCLKQDNGDDVSISKVSRKTKAEKVCHHLMMYAYGSSSKEPLCSKLYPGNVPDSVAVGDFIKSMDIREGIIVADRGFKAENMADITKEYSGLHYIVPLMKGRDVIKGSGALDFDRVLERDDGPVAYRKVEVTGPDGKGTGTWLYAFNDPAIAAEMAGLYYSNHRGGISSDDLKVEREWFGTIVLQSDLDLEPDFVYDSYDGRWDIECLFRMHKSGLDLDATDEKSEASTMGSDFVSFVATLMASRLRNHLAGFEACKNMSYRSALSDLNDCVKVRKDGVWEYRLTSKKDMKFYVAVGAVTEPDMMSLFSEPEPTEDQGVARKRGRPKGSRDKRPRTRRTIAEIAGSD